MIYVEIIHSSIILHVPEKDVKKGRISGSSGQKFILDIFQKRFQKNHPNNLSRQFRQPCQKNRPQISRINIFPAQVLEHQSVFLRNSTCERQHRDQLLREHQLIFL